MQKVANIEKFLKERHGELSEFLTENMSYDKQTKKDAKTYSYKLGQYDIITELCHKARINIDYEK